MTITQNFATEDGKSFPMPELAIKLEDVINYSVSSPRSYTWETSGRTTKINTTQPTDIINESK